MKEKRNEQNANEELLVFKKEYLVSRIDKVLSLLEKREESILFEDQNVFRHPCIIEKIRKEPAALFILHKKEKQWLRKKNTDPINNENIYIFIADTLSELINNFPTNKNVKRAIILSYELLAIKIMLYPVYKNKKFSELVHFKYQLLEKENHEIEEKHLKELMNVSEKLNPELHKFVKNWTRSITFDLKVKMTTFVMNLTSKIKDVNKNNVVFNEATKKSEIYSTREDVFNNIAERLLEYSLNNFWVEEFNFLSARLINKNPKVYSQVILKNRLIKEDGLFHFENKIRALFSSKNTYLSSEYQKYDQIFYKGINHGLSKLNNLRGVDYHSARIIFDIFMIESLKQSQEDKPYINFKAVESSVYYKSLIYGLKPYSILKLKIRTMNGDFGRGERTILGGENLLEIIKETLRINVLNDEEFTSIFNNLKVHNKKVDINNFYNVFFDYAEEFDKKKEVKDLFTRAFTEIEKDIQEKKRNTFNVLSKNQQESIRISLLSAIKSVS